MNAGIKGETADLLQQQLRLTAQSAKGLFILTSSTAWQTSEEAENERNGRVMGRFTRAVVECLTAVPSGFREEILFSDLATHVANAFKGQDVREFRADAQGDPIIARAPRPVFHPLADVIGDLNSPLLRRRHGAATELTEKLRHGSAEERKIAREALQSRLETEGEDSLRSTLSSALTEVDRKADRAAATRKTRAKRQIARLNKEKGQPDFRIESDLGVSSPRQPDLTIIVHPRERDLMVSSPRDRACLDHVSIPGISIPADGFDLSKMLRAYDRNMSVPETERHLRVVGNEIGKCLPSDLRSLLRRPDVRTVMLCHDGSFNFPLELCLLEDKDDHFFIGDRIAVTRRYLGVSPPTVSRHVGRVAFLRGEGDAAARDEAILNDLYPGRITTFPSVASVHKDLFGSREFDLIQFTGHFSADSGEPSEMRMDDGGVIRVEEIGLLASEREFLAAEPFVILNGSGSAELRSGRRHPGSFADRFVTGRACAVVGTLWPIPALCANEFTAVFHEALRAKAVSDALLSTKLEILGRVAQSADETELTTINIGRLAGVRSYVLFADPNLRLDMSKPDLGVSRRPGPLQGSAR